MAYINQETKKEVTPAIKAVLKKYGMKGSISINHHMTLVVTLKSGKLDIIENWFTQQVKHNDREVFDKPDNINVNQYWIDTNYTGIVKDFLNELVCAMKTPDWRNNSDIQSDYFDISYYTDIKVGKYDTPYIVEV